MTINWRNLLVSKSDSIQQAIQLIDSESSRFVLVTEEDDRLLGVVSDGDVRRGLINRIGLERPVTEIMNTNPIVGGLDDARSKLLALMEQKDLLHIPMVADGKVVGLETLQHLLKRERFDNPVFLMAGGFGTRLRPLTENCPKPLLKVGDKPILETILEGFVEAGFHRFYISTHYMPEMIRECFGDGADRGVSIEYIHEEVPLGTGGALGLLPKNLPELPLIMMNGDLLTKVNYANLLRYHNEHDARATMCVREYEYQVPYGVIQAEGNRITNMVEKPKQKFFVNAGIYVVSPEIIKGVSANQRIDMPSLLEAQILDDQLVTMFPVHEYWLDIGRLIDFEQAQADFVTEF